MDDRRSVVALAANTSARGDFLEALIRLKHRPPENDVTPWDGQPIPRGHRIDDALWPWVGGAAAEYDATNLNAFGKSLLPDTSATPAVAVRAVLDTTTMDYRYV
jgi:tyrosinase